MAELVVPIDSQSAPVPKRQHPTRETSDADLSNTVRLIRWTPAKLKRFQDAFYANARYNEALDDLPFDVFYATVANAAPFTYEFGDFGAVCLLFPATPGHDATVHLFVFDPMYLRRPALWRAGLRFLFKKHAFRRIQALLPETYPLVVRLAERVGFKHEGTLRNGVLYNGEGRNLLVYGLLPEEV